MVMDTEVDDGLPAGVETWMVQNAAVQYAQPPHEIFRNCARYAGQGSFLENQCWRLGSGFTTKLMGSWYTISKVFRFRHL